jgi:hypothetical protein
MNPLSLDPPRQPPEQEVDVWWGSYAGRTMLPDFLICAVLTAAIAVATRIVASMVQLGPNFARYTTDGLAGALWLWLLLRWAYRVVAFNYRLTTRHLFYDKAFDKAYRPGIDLAQLREVEVQRGPAERALGVGRLCIRAGGEPVILPGVRDPGHVAELIREQVRRVRQGM